MSSTALEILLYVVSIPVFGFAFVMVLVMSYERARRKGYRPPGTVLVILAGWTVGIAITVIRHPPNSTSYRFFVDFLWVPLLLSAAATAAIILIRPSRELRVFSARQVKFPLVRVGEIVIGLGVVLCVITLVFWLTGKTGSITVIRALTLWMAFLVPTGSYLIRRGRRLTTAPSLDERFLQDSRSPVLYLRAFKQEKQFFVIGPKSEYGMYAKSWHARVARSDQKIGITFEQYLSDQVESDVGPFVALGSPEDYLAPEGASRMYAKDTDWMEKLDQLARRSACILVEMGKSDNLRWEFEHLRQEGLQQKMFVITRPSTEGPSFQWAFWGLLWRLRGIHAVRWPEFSREMARLGYELGPENPGDGSVITFDAEAQGILLTTAADRPADFVEPLRVWVAGKGKVGRYVPSSCANCGRRVYAFPTQVPMASLCHNCQEGSPTKRTWKRIAPTLYVLLACLLFVAFMVGAAIWVPKGSWMDRHIGGIGTVVVIGLIVGCFALTIWTDSGGESPSGAQPRSAPGRGKRMMR
jgi:hypothetical protein